ncbi:hypothetical protein CMQ_4417 [Grosmannia clavigera kw1407]|uniref:Uncharacterized protein n=1 Tax=Grosmannia clavigera (strain kw1407 / UAMH 11150) TaxID=655863 RepID=F0XUA1_GROCL|nr:uncharacterized protein CMQ_4417 [Grosmannia clavigera kw1407]EFW98565.1 hypothetical protein CMQ_4417 [Grosmannia clavigera kw1407]
MSSSNAERGSLSSDSVSDLVRAEYPYTDDYRAFSSGSSTGTPLSPSSTLTSSSCASSTVLTKTAAVKNANKNVNVHTTCGRHSNEWLFSGWPSPFRRRDQ